MAVPNRDFDDIFEELSLEPVRRVSRDLRAAADLLTHDQARYLVDTYYDVQAVRLASDGRRRAAEKDDEPNDTVSWTVKTMVRIEDTIRIALDIYTERHLIGRWSKSIVGIGPVIAAGLMAYIPMETTPGIGNLWSFAGLDPSVEWGKGEKRPWNARLKVLGWKAGESFVKVSNKPDDYYGKLYKRRKERDQATNERGGFAEAAAKVLERKNFRETTDAIKHYRAGHLPPAHIHARARRFATKIFLAHWFAVNYEITYHKPAPMPYVIAVMGHKDYLPPPNWENSKLVIGANALPMHL